MEQPETTPARGETSRKLLLFAAPVLGASLLQVVNTSVNAVWIGRLLGARGLAATTTAHSFQLVLIAFVFGLGAAVSIGVAQRIGAKDIAGAKRVVGTGAVMFAGLSAILVAICAAATDPLLIALHTPPEVLPLASTYLRTILLSLPAMYLFTFALLALQGAGDARMAFVAMAISVLADVGLNPLLISGFGPIPRLGIAGSALATVLVYWFTLFGVVYRLYAKRHFIRIQPQELHLLRIDPKIARLLLGKGIPIALQHIVLSSSTMTLVGLVNRYGTKTSAAYACSGQMGSYIQMPALALGSAVSAMVAQNIGASQSHRIDLIARTGIVFALSTTALFAFGPMLARDFAFRVFLGADRETVNLAGHIYLITTWTFLFSGSAYVLAGAVRGAGVVIAPLLCFFTSLWFVRIPFAYVLSSHIGAEGVWWSFPIGGAASLALAASYYRFGSWRKRSLLTI